jgi:hypothetical protein
VQLHALRDGDTLDGIALTLFGDEDSARAAMASPRIVVDAREDEGRFLDRSRCTSFLCDAVPAAIEIAPGSVR